MAGERLAGPGNGDRDSDFDSGSGDGKCRRGRFHDGAPGPVPDPVLRLAIRLQRKQGWPVPAGRAGPQFRAKRGALRNPGIHPATGEGARTAGPVGGARRRAVHADLVRGDQGKWNVVRPGCLRGAATDRLARRPADAADDLAEKGRNPGNPGGDDGGQGRLRLPRVPLAAKRGLPRFRRPPGRNRPAWFRHQELGARLPLSGPDHRLLLSGSRIHRVAMACC